MAEPRHARQLTPRRRIGELLLIAAAFGAAVGVVTLTGATRALFSDSAQKAATVGAGHIFPGTRSTSAFSVTDRSGGSAVDRSSVLAYAGDGRTVTTSAWSTAFASDRYLQFDFNDPLPAGLSTSAVTFRLLAGGTDSGASECAYVELRRASDDGLISTFGSSGSPLTCTSGTTVALLSLGIGVGSTDVANDLRIRVYGYDSAGAASTLDEATVTGSTPYSSFTLYPIRYTDAASGTPVSVPWELQGS